MSENSVSPAVFRPEVLTDIAALAVHGGEVVAAAAAILDDLAHARVVGSSDSGTSAQT